MKIENGATFSNCLIVEKVDKKCLDVFKAENGELLYSFAWCFDGRSRGGFNYYVILSMGQSLAGSIPLSHTVTDMYSTQRPEQ